MPQEQDNPTLPGSGSKLRRADLLKHMQAGNEVRKGKMWDWTHVNGEERKLNRVVLRQLQREGLIKLNHGGRGKHPTWVLTEKGKLSP
jgi:ribosomal protein S19E (S16A)